MAKRKTDPLDAQISNAWARLASGVQVNIMDIPAIFRSVRATVSEGIELDTAIKAAIEVYAQNKTRGDR